MDGRRPQWQGQRRLSRRTARHEREHRKNPEGLKDAFKGQSEIKWIGQEPFEVTNWDPSQMATVIAALIAKYPQIDGIFADLSGPV